MSEVSEKVRKALFAKMNTANVVGTNKATAIYYDEAPPNAVFPYVVFARVPGTVDYAFQENRVGERDRYFVKVYSDKNTSSAESTIELNERILGLIETEINNSLTITGGTVSRIVRIADIPSTKELLNDRYVYGNGFQFEVYANV